MADRQPAFDERAEQAVLGGVLIRPDAFGDLKNLLPEQFYLPTHEYIFGVLQRMYLDGDKIDAMTVFSELEKDGKLRKVGGAPYLHTLMESCTSPENIGYYSNIIREKWKLRKVNEVGIRMAALNATDVDDIPNLVEQAREFMDELDISQTQDFVRFRDLYDLWIEAQADERPAIETPWVVMNDRLAGGLQRQRLYVVGARPGCGKTIMGAQMALYAAQMHHKSLIFSLELSKEDLMGRILSCGARANYGEITRRDQSAETQAKISRWVSAYPELPLQVDDKPDHTIETIMQACRIKKQREGLDFVFIDYLQLVEQSKGQNRVEAVDHIATRARHIARKLDCVVVVAAQLNRKIEDNGGKPRLPTKSDFRESGGIEQTADAAIVLSRPVDDNGDEADKMPMMNVTLVKNRTGQEGTFQLNERFDQARFA